MDLTNLAVNGVSVSVLIMLVVQAIKAFGVSNTKAIQVIALSLGFLLVGYKYGVDNALIAENVAVYVNWFLYAVLGGLSAMGLFDFVKVGLPTRQ